MKIAEAQGTQVFLQRYEVSEVHGALVPTGRTLLKRCKSEDHAKSWAFQYNTHIWRGVRPTKR